MDGHPGLQQLLPGTYLVNTLPAEVLSHLSDADALVDILLPSVDDAHETSFEGNDAVVQHVCGIGACRGEKRDKQRGDGRAGGEETDHTNHPHVIARMHRQAQDRQTSYTYADMHLKKSKDPCLNVQRAIERYRTDESTSAVAGLSDEHQ